MVALVLEQDEMLSTHVGLIGSCGHPAWLGHQGELQQVP